MSDISVQEIRDSLTAVWEALLKKNNCKQAHQGKQRFLFRPGNYTYIFLKLVGMPSCISNTVPEHWVRTTEKQKRKNESLVHRSTMGFIVTCGVHQRGSWQVRTSFPTRKFPERKNLCLKNSSPANQETEISWCALLPCPKHFWVPLPLLFLPFTFYK